MPGIQKNYAIKLVGYNHKAPATFIQTARSIKSNKILQSYLVYSMALEMEKFPKKSTRCPVIFRDEWILAVNKPSGVLSHPNNNRKNERVSFEGAYDFHDRRFDTPEGPLWLIHRLDQDASGILLAAFDKTSVHDVRMLFENHRIQKNYVALVWRKPPQTGIWQDHLSERREKNRIRSSVVNNRKPNAKLRYSVSRFFPAYDLSLLSITLITGKTHQIRVQAASRGYPIVGDTLYGNFAMNRMLRKKLGFRRLFLHAESLSFTHPKIGRILNLRAPLPDELTECLSLIDYH